MRIEKEHCCNVPRPEPVDPRRTQKHNSALIPIPTKTPSFSNASSVTNYRFGPKRVKSQFSTSLCIYLSVFYKLPRPIASKIIKKCHPDRRAKGPKSKDLVHHNNNYPPFRPKNCHSALDAESNFLIFPFAFYAFYWIMGDYEGFNSNITTGKAGRTSARCRYYPQKVRRHTNDHPVRLLCPRQGRRAHPNRRTHDSRIQI